MDGEGDRTVGQFGGGPRLSDWFELGEYGRSQEIEHVAPSGASMSGTGNLSQFYCDTGGHCHRDQWIFRTGLGSSSISRCLDGG